VNILSKISSERLLSESLREPLSGDGKHESVDADGEEHDEGDDDKHERVEVSPGSHNRRITREESLETAAIMDRVQLQQP